MPNLSVLLTNLRTGVAALAARPSLQVLQKLAEVRGVRLYLVGGTLRDLALGRVAPDLDLAVSAQAIELARDLAAALKGAFVLLDEEQGAARVVCRGAAIDLTRFRGPTLANDLEGRDFTLNALALDLRAALGRCPWELIDPLGGLSDLSQGLLRMVSAANFRDDPLRLLRAYRFAATHDLKITPETITAIKSQVDGFSRVAGERVHQELFHLLSSPQAAPLLMDMHEVGLLARIFPEIMDMAKVVQNGYHHLDVLHHSLETVVQLEKVLAAPGDYFEGLAPEISSYAARHPKAALLKVAALFHDVGKPQVREHRQLPVPRYTFYHHERVGLEIFAGIAERLRFSQAEVKVVSLLIREHMRPFLLLPAFRQDRLTTRALGRLVRAVRSEFPGFFALAMADSLAGQGANKPPDSEKLLAELADTAYRFLKERLEPQTDRPRLLTGHDLIKVLGLAPGPRFRQLLTAVEEAQWEGRVASREEALKLVRQLLAKR